MVELTSGTRNARVKDCSSHTFRIQTPLVDNPLLIDGTSEQSERRPTDSLDRAVGCHAELPAVGMGGNSIGDIAFIHRGDSHCELDRPEWARCDSPGQRPGYSELKRSNGARQNHCTRSTHQKPQFVTPLQGVSNPLHEPRPRPLAWAFLSGPFGAH